MPTACKYLGCYEPATVRLEACNMDYCRAHLLEVRNQLFNGHFHHSGFFRRPALP